MFQLHGSEFRSLLHNSVNFLKPEPRILHCLLGVFPKGGHRLGSRFKSNPETGFSLGHKDESSACHIGRSSLEKDIADQDIFGFGLIPAPQLQIFIGILGRMKADQEELERDRDKGADCDDDDEENERGFLHEQEQISKSRDLAEIDSICEIIDEIDTRAMSESIRKAADLLQQDGEWLLRLPILESLFDEAEDLAFFVKDSEGYYLFVNQSLVERHGFSRKSDLIGKRPIDVFPGSMGEVPTRQDSKVLIDGASFHNHLEIQWLRPHEPCWCLTSKFPLRNEKGKIVGLVGFSRDLRDPIPIDTIPAPMALVLDEFEADPGERVSPSQLAERSQMSAHRFARVTKRVFGLTPSQYITRTRIKAATRLLEDTEETVSEIAMACGFSDHSAFTRAFRSATGFSPTQFRELKRGK